MAKGHYDWKSSKQHVGVFIRFKASFKSLLSLAGKAEDPFSLESNNIFGVLVKQTNKCHLSAFNLVVIAIHRAISRPNRIEII